MTKLQKSKIQLIEILIHIIICSIVLAFPFLIFNKEGYSERMLHHAKEMTVMQLAFIAIFYINYLVLIPRLIFRNKTGQYILINMALLLIMLFGTHLWQEFNINFLQEKGFTRPLKKGPPKWIFTIRDASTMIMVICVSVAIRMSKKWVQTESARREAEKSKTEAELKNLRAQINPHFLLNTLNNIYALIAFNTDKAQQAVQELSRLLRYVLYDNQQTTVSLGKEAEFIKNYIELMKIRLADNVKLQTEIDIDKDNRTQIAPLIFISFIENSFKHGISPTEDSFIKIELSEHNGYVTCHTENSNYPKSDKDKSGSGLGLEQVKKRLELLYKDRYKWVHKVDKEKNTYVSTLTIKA